MIGNMTNVLRPISDKSGLGFNEFVKADEVSAPTQNESVPCSCGGAERKQAEKAANQPKRKGAGKPTATSSPRDIPESSKDAELRGNIA